MGLVDEIAEARIRSAVERGEFDDLEGAGRPLSLEDDSLVPPELRMAYKVLCNAGYVPEEVRLRRVVAELEDLLGTLDAGAHDRALKRLALLRSRLGAVRGSAANLQLEGHYYRKLMERLAQEHPSEPTAGSHK